MTAPSTKKQSTTVRGNGRGKAHSSPDPRAAKHDHRPPGRRPEMDGSDGTPAFTDATATLVNPPMRRQIKDALLRAILGGQLKPGERLVELKLAHRFGTSQAPIREALRDLEATGLVIARPRRGTFVADVSSDRLREIYAVRGALEALATSLATASGACDLEILEREIGGMREAARRGDLNKLGDHSVAFHRAIVVAANNHLLLHIWSSLQIETRTTITLLVGDLDLEVIAESHQPIIDAIASGDAERAGHVARDHQSIFER